MWSNSRSPPTSALRRRFGAPAALAMHEAMVSTVDEVGRVAEARNVSGQLALVLRGGPEVRLGRGEDIPLQLTVAQRVLALLSGKARYVDVSVPEQAVAG